MLLDLSAPEPLKPRHIVNDFSCGESTLDNWLKRKALTNQGTGASRTFVVSEADNRVLGYYALAAGSVVRADATGRIRRNMPDPIPILVLGRLAVDRSVQGAKVGSSLLKDAVIRATLVSENIEARALLVHALDEKVKDFYLKHGFISSPTHYLTVMLRL